MNKLTQKIQKKEPIVGDFSKVFENVDAMSQMNSQMKDNMFGMMGKFFQGEGRPAIFSQTPADVQKIMQSMKEMMPDMRKTAQGMHAMMPDFPIMMQNMVQTVLPIVHQEALRVISNFNQMNQMKFEMRKKFLNRR